MIKPITIKDHRGLFDGGRNDSVPKGYYQDCQNLEFEQNSAKTRRGFVKVLTMSNIVRALTYTPTNQVSRKLILDNTGKIFDELYPGAPILNIPAMTDFALQTMFGRAYISSHNGQTGLPGESLYVYQGSGVVARLAGGAPYVAGTAGTSTPVVGGHIEPGLRLFTLVFETDTGFITKPGVFTFVGSVATMAPGDKKLNFSAISVGPAGTVARHILVTKSIPGSTILDGFNYEYFFAAKINDNVTTVYNGLDFYDSDLIYSADYLMDTLPTIPAGVFLSEYNGRLVTGGESGNNSHIRVSTPGNCENFSGVDGFAIVNPGDAGGGVKNGCEHNGNFHIYKTSRAYVTRDNGDIVTSWPVEKVDVAVGTECHGISKVSDAVGNTANRYLIVNKRGIIVYDGSFAERELTWSIQGAWSRINPLYFNKVQIYVDPDKKHIFVNLPLDANTTPNMLLFGDYTEGLDYANIKWTPWLVPGNPKTILVENDSVLQKPTFKYSGGTNVFAIDDTNLSDDGVAIESYFVTNGNPDNQDGFVNHIAQVGYRASGVGDLQVTIYSQDLTVSQTLKSWTMTALPDRDFVCLSNFKSEKFFVKFRMNIINNYFSIYSIRLAISKLWMSRAL